MATRIPITDEQRRAAEASAARVAATPLPTALELSKHLAAVRDALNDLTGGDCDAERILSERADALRDLIGTVPATTLGDVAAQIDVASVISARLSCIVMSREAVEASAEVIERMLYGMLPIVAKAAGLDMDEMSWDGAAYLRVLRFGGVGVVS